MSRKTETIATFEVRIPVPAGGNIAALSQYIRDAIGNWSGGGDPSDPLFHLDRETIVVKLKEKKTTYA